MNIDRDQLKRNFGEPQRRPPQPVRPQPEAPRQAPVAPPTNISINISLPGFKKPTLPKWNYRRIGTIAAIIIGFVVLSLIIRGVVVFVVHKHRAYEAAHQLSLVKSPSAKPSYTPLVPKDKAAAVAKTAAYDPKRESYSYSDTFKGTGVIVSQQPLDGDSTALAKIAKSLNATTPIVASNGTAYLASNPSGAQTIVMSSGSLLVFVQSAFTHSADDWKGYLDTLQS